MHAYVDDVVVKTKQSGTLLDDLKETFAKPSALSHEAQPREMHLWHAGWITPRLYHFPARDRG
jgi:hypothetical protein